MTQTPLNDLKIKGRLVLYPESLDGEGHIDLGEVEFALTLQPSKPLLRTRPATGGVVLPTGPTAPSGISRQPAIDAAVRGMTLDMYNGR